MFLRKTKDHHIQTYFCSAQANSILLFALQRHGLLASEPELAFNSLHVNFARESSVFVSVMCYILTGYLEVWSDLAQDSVNMEKRRSHNYVAVKSFVLRVEHIHKLLDGGPRAIL